MSDHKAELIDAAYSLIEDAIDKFAGNKSVDASRRGMFAIEKTPKGASSVKTINLSVKLSNGGQKHFSLNVECEHNVMLLLKINYYVLHALALVSMATRGEPVDAYVDQFNDYNDEKESDEVSGKYCRNGVKAKREQALAAGVVAGGGAKAPPRKKKAAPKKKAPPASAAAAAAAAKKKKKAAATKKKASS